MDKFEYELIINDIKKLERISKKIEFKEEYLKITKPSILEIKTRNNWKEERKKLLIEKTRIQKELLIAYTKLEKLF